ncbi:MAG: signal peptide peptidase SppA [Actinobacteria bacterium]|nr:signal peptide peptidase SppA [Actinomycetota bacterium]
MDNQDPSQAGVPPVPQQGAPVLPHVQYVAADQGQAIPSQQIPQVIIQMPAEKKSKAPLIIALIIVLVLILGTCFSFYSCSNMVSRFGSSSGSVITMDDTVAVIHMNGQIAASGSGYITPESFAQVLHAAEVDSIVKAIVLRIDSPGGTAAASQELSTYLSACTKPVVVSAADTCASGAYMAASQTDYIYALPSSTVGSIGVIMTISNYEELLDMLGISIENITSGDAKDAGSAYRALTDEERATFQAQVDQINDQFIDMVAEGRSLDRAKVVELATGATFTGQDAVGLGLIDGLGTFEDACDKAAELGGIQGEYNTANFDMEADFNVLSLLG